MSEYFHVCITVYFVADSCRRVLRAGDPRREQRAGRACLWEVLWRSSARGTVPVRVSDVLPHVPEGLPSERDLDGHLYLWEYQQPRPGGQLLHVDRPGERKWEDGPPVLLQLDGECFHTFLQLEITI